MPLRLIRRRRPARPSFDIVRQERPLDRLLVEVPMDTNVAFYAVSARPLRLQLAVVVAANAVSRPDTMLLRPVP